VAEGIICCEFVKGGEAGSKEPDEVGGNINRPQRLSIHIDPFLLFLEPNVVAFRANRWPYGRIVRHKSFSRTLAAYQIVSLSSTPDVITHFTC
jgi:hypothetical protein